MAAYLRFLLVGIVVFSTQTVFAENDDISIVGGVAYNIKNERFDIANKPFKPDFVTIEWSLIAAYKSAYVKLNYDESVKDGAQVDTTPSSGGGSNDNQALLFDRKDAGITFGYSVLEGLSLFAGYTRGETGVTGTGDFSVQGNLTSSYIETAFSTLTVNVTEQGPFVGASYSYYLKDSGSLSFSLAYARLDGEVQSERAEKVTTIDMTGSTEVTTIDGSLVKGDATGFSYSIVWTDRFTESMLYNLSLKTTRYKFDAPPLGSDNLDFNDVYNIFSIGFSKFF